MSPWTPKMFKFPSSFTVTKASFRRCLPQTEGILFLPIRPLLPFGLGLVFVHLYLKKSLSSLGRFLFPILTILPSFPSCPHLFIRSHFLYDNDSHSYLFRSSLPISVPTPLPPSTLYLDFSEATCLLTKPGYNLLLEKPTWSLNQYNIQKLVKLKNVLNIFEDDSEVVRRPPQLQVGFSWSAKFT